ncbi:diaminobutyrate acetyltransferase [Williamsia phyllosphaerae]|uniref:L-2,4-diaminobutyric acid acetyltransferase n=1 Tax=Williamsia phyllosphaerae TaxID=885042 RepID=A0ABQ1V608_9NOCA|nr:diaminobutyrate acetyltransferase [Williamsia phyllosphaerae]GGF39521.1 L-2,4-diaminobutyric acid acetyltransferase [Williamsia phyllosphaerae]
MTPTQMSATLTPSPEVTFRAPDVSDGVRLWEIARDSEVLDLNSSYSYVLWCQDYSRTSVVAEVDGKVVGFVTGYVRPQAPDTVMVWQVAVDADQRGLGLAGRMLTALMDRVEGDAITRMQTTISPDNDASQALFTRFAERRGMTITRRDYFAPEVFPDSHEPEDLYTIAPRT